MSVEDSSSIKERIALLEARLKAQQALLEAEVQKRLIVEEKLAELTAAQPPGSR